MEPTTIIYDIANHVGIKQQDKNGQYIVSCPIHEDSDPSCHIGYKEGRFVVNCFSPKCDKEKLFEWFRTRFHLPGHENFERKGKVQPLGQLYENAATKADWQKLLTRQALTGQDYEQYECGFRPNRHFASRGMTLDSIAYPLLTMDYKTLYQYRSIATVEFTDDKTGAKYFKRLSHSDKGLTNAIFPAEKRHGDGPLYVTAGFEKAILLNKLGFRAVSTHAGEQTIAVDVAKWLVTACKNPEIVICLDNDKAGRLGLPQWIGAFRAAGASKVLVVQIPVEGMDINDFVRERHTRERDGAATNHVETLLANPVCSGLIQVKAEAEFRERYKLNRISFGQLCSSNLAPPVPLVNGILYGGLSLLAGDPKAGKSYMAMQLACSLILGRPFLGQTVKAPENPSVIWLRWELGNSYAKEYFHKLCEGFNITPEQIGERFEYIDARALDLSLTEQSLECVDVIAEEHRQRGWNPVLVVIDTYMDAVAFGKNQNSSYREQEQNKAIKAWAEAHCDMATLIIHHNKKGDKGERGATRIMGTNMMRAMADCNIILEREPGAIEATLTFEGRAKYLGDNKPVDIKQHANLWVSFEELAAAYPEPLVKPGVELDIIAQMEKACLPI